MIGPVQPRVGASFALLGVVGVVGLLGVGCGRQGALTPAPSSRPSAAPNTGASPTQTNRASSTQNDGVSTTHNSGASSTRAGGALRQAHPQAIEPVAGAISPAAAPSSGLPRVSVAAPGSGSDGALAQPVSETQVRQELAQSGMSASPNQATLTPAGLAVAPIDAPTAVQDVIAAGNEIARLPYRYGGGHVTYEDTAYDCSGSISFVFDAAHLLGGSVVSGQLERWGNPGPGKWITVFANAGHTFMYVAGLRFDTVALAETGSRWSDRSANEPDLSTFAVRHPPRL
jgi:cell wall-associated NlpC family hydrolase